MTCSITSLLASDFCAVCPSKPLVPQLQVQVTHEPILLLPKVSNPEAPLLGFLPALLPLSSGLPNGVFLFLFLFPLPFEHQALADPAIPNVPQARGGALSDTLPKTRTSLGKKS